MQGSPVPLLEVQDLSIGFDSDQGTVAITDRVSFTIAPGEAYGLVGESGCGKSVTCLSLLKLLPSPGGRVLGGRILFQGRDILALPMDDLRALRGSGIGMIFQEPGAALNPLWTIRRQLLEPFRYHPHEGDPEARIRFLLQRVGIADPSRVLDAYPHQMSGGMLQRVMIAMALSLNPALLIADEPTTALDVTVQAQIMELLEELRREFNAALLMVTHNLNLVAQYADRVGVMYAGRIVEESPVVDFLARPLHPYSRGLLDALPRLNRPDSRPRPIPGQVPRPKDYEEGCRFRERCPHAFAACVRKPAAFPAGTSDSRGIADSRGGSEPGGSGHTVSCFLHENGPVPLPDVRTVEVTP